MHRATTDPDWDEQNLTLTRSSADIDAINAQFYGKFPFPPRAFRLERPLDPDFQRTFLCQDVGDWQHRSVPARPAIWVAGCGTNQAVITALAFPRATVVGSDLSLPSLEMAERGLRDLSLGNLRLRQESLNGVTYREEFDFIVCTGVIHHNSDPAAALQRIAQALKPGGILELMVYNRYQRIPSSCVQKALLILAGGELVPDDERKLRMAESLVKGFEAPGRMGVFLSGLRSARRSELADCLMQPVEYSYSVASLDELARFCGLEMLQPVVNAYSKLQGNITWDLNLPDPQLQEAYLRLDDLQRWQVANLLLGESAPLLWFYFRRASATPRPSDREVCDAFLATRFAPAATRKQAYQLDESDSYRLVPGSIAYPPPLHDRLRPVVEAADGKTPMREILGKHGIAMAFPEVNEIRARLTTSAFPYLKAVAG
jgi:SAM-dependent methyltransferase